MKWKVLFILILNITAVFSQNPITPEGFYMSDPSGRVFNDKLYIYGSCDDSNNRYCSSKYDVISTDNMVNWKIDYDVFSSKGVNDQVPYADANLLAPDCIYKNGKYYLYYCMMHKDEKEGVATSSTPWGPFKNGKVIKGATQIDPSVFIDDDGQSYLFWGQFSAKAAKLTKDMMELDTSTIQDSILTEKEHNFHEGIQIFKRNGIYYLSYADIGRRGRPTCLGYSTSKSIFGPYKYQGVIIDNFGCDPNVWNNHGSVIQKDNKWYVLYHRSTEGGKYLRKACIEPINFDEQGNIKEVEMTTQGVLPYINPFENLSAAKACYLTGHVRVHNDENKRDMLNQIFNEDTAAYKYFNFIKAPKSIEITLLAHQEGNIEIYADNMSRNLLCRIDVPESDKNELITLKSKMFREINGIHTIYLKFRGTKEDTNLYSVYSLKFSL